MTLGNYLQCNRRTKPDWKPKPIPAQGNYTQGYLGQMASVTTTNDGDYMDFSARLAGLNPSPCNRQLGFQRICFRSRSEISARDETHHVIGPLSSKDGVCCHATPLLVLSLFLGKNIFKIAKNVLKTYFSCDIFCSTTLRV